jgi:hypothetical protein
MMKHDPMVNKEMPSCFIVISTSFWNIVNWQIFQYVVLTWWGERQRSPSRRPAHG